MKPEKMVSLVGKHVFLVIDGGRSIACDVLKVKDGKVYAIEVNCDHWPFKYVEMPVEKVVYALYADEVEDCVKAEHMAADPAEFEIVGRLDIAGEDFFLDIGGPAELFGALRSWLNDEDGLGRPLKKAKKGKKSPAA